MDIKLLRKQLGLTQLELAAKLGIWPQTVKRWEEGVSKPNGMARKLLEELEKVKKEG